MNWYVVRVTVEGGEGRKRILVKAETPLMALNHRAIWPWLETCEFVSVEKIERTVS